MNLWLWIGANSATLAAWVTALATVGAAVVAVVYVIATRALARSAADQASAAKVQAEATHQMFEAAYRPYMSIRLEDWRSFFEDPDFYLFIFQIDVFGDVPANETRWRLQVSDATGVLVDRSSTASDPRQSFYPGAVDSVWLGKPHQQICPRGTPGPDVTASFTVHYRRAPSTTEYLTRVTVRGKYQAWSGIDYVAE